LLVVVEEHTMVLQVQLVLEALVVEVLVKTVQEVVEQLTLVVELGEDEQIPLLLVVLEVQV
tara:strand:- start:4 stop:186 length:183 start_codon:yes stop_codon:yes gene_type:complete